MNAPDSPPAEHRLYLVAADDQREPEVRNGRVREWPREVPIAGADMGEALLGDDVKEGLETLGYVMVASDSRAEVQAELDYLDSLRGSAPTTRVSGQGYVRVVLAAPHELWNGRGWFRFELTPDKALAFAGELTRAAAHAVE